MKIEIINGLILTAIIYALVYVINLLAKEIMNKPLKTNNIKIDPPQELKNPKIEIALLLEHNIKINSFHLKYKNACDIDHTYKFVKYNDWACAYSTYTPSDLYLKNWFPWLDRLDKELLEGVINPQEYQDKIAPHLDIVNEIKADQTKHREDLQEKIQKILDDDFQNFLFKNKHKLIDPSIIRGILLKEDGRLDLTDIVKNMYFDRIDKTKDFTVENSILIIEEENK